MKSVYISCCIGLLLAGCGEEQPSAKGYTSSPRLIATEPGQPKAVDEIRQVLASLERGTPIWIRYDRVRALEDGREERQVFVEILGPSAEETDLLAMKVFGQAGFTVRKGLVDRNGIRLQYRKSGVEPINVLIRSLEAGPPLSDPAATSSLYVRQSVH